MSIDNELDEVERFQKILEAFKIKAICVSHEQVRNVSLYHLKLYAGTRIQTLQKFSEEMALALRAKSKLNFHSDMETGQVRVEVVDDSQHKINLISELKGKVIPKALLPVYVGSSIEGNDVWTDLAKNPHLLIAGTTGSGKSVLLHTILTNLLLLSKAKVFVIDTKALEFEPYKEKYGDISIGTTYSEACDILEYLIAQMELRYSMMRHTTITFPPMVLMIDEFADLIMQDVQDKLYNLVCRLAQKSRASGIYCIVATQRPSVDIIRGAIKANLPARIACKVSSKVSSRVILDQNGAELLIGNGDAIISNYDHDFVRFQAAFTSPKDLLSCGLTRADFTFAM
jgi:S-DNA-T family DNA segregation ATPase FtsK/SpoIIIE